ncbi:MAG TPA: DUF1549 domain-containing protein [Planctomycetaceae bacterium]|nr:DUF1549 domain-containing protein [Planctomycetaceae bacterium]
MFRNSLLLPCVMCLCLGELAINSPAIAQDDAQHEWIELRQLAQEEQGYIEEQLGELKNDASETKAERALVQATETHLKTVRGVIDELLKLKESSSLPQARTAMRRIEALELKWSLVDEPKLAQATILEELTSLAEEEPRPGTESMLKRLRELQQREMKNRAEELRLIQARTALEEDQEKLQEEFYKLFEADEDDEETDAGQGENEAEEEEARSIDQNRVSFSKATPTSLDVGDVATQLDRVLGTETTPRVADEVFLRRVWLDLGGTVPFVEYTHQFLEDRTADKRDKLIGRLLSSRYFFEHFSGRISHLLTGRRPVQQTAVNDLPYNGDSLRQFLQISLSKDRPYDQVVRTLLTSKGLVAEGKPGFPAQPSPTNFLMRYEGRPVPLTIATSTSLLGITLQCAQCHDHPQARWKQSDFHGIAAAFGGLRMFYYDGNEADDDEPFYAVVQEIDTAQYRFTSKPLAEDAVAPVVKARLLDETRPFPQGNRRTEVFAQWVTAKENPYFARNFVNHVWFWMMGHRFAASLDDIETLPPTARQALDLLANDFAAHGFHVRRLVATIASTRAYQSAVVGDSTSTAFTEKSIGDGTEEESREFIHPTTRPFTVDQLYHSVDQVTERVLTDSLFPKEEGDSSFDPSVEAFGEHSVSYARSLIQRNSDSIAIAIQEQVEKMREELGDAPIRANIERFYLATLVRRPTDRELTWMTKLAKSEPDGRGLEDVLWVLLNSVEFNTNH